MTAAVLGLGSNLGDRKANLRAAVAGLQAAVLATSGVYETIPWGDQDQPMYLNAAVLVADPDASPRDWLDRAQALERAAGRVRDPARPLGPRTLDVDVIAVWDDAGNPFLVDEPGLTLPHPRAHLRAFVLRPWADLRPWVDTEPYGRLPGHGRVTDLLGSEPVAADLAAARARGELG